MVRMSKEVTTEKEMLDKLKQLYGPKVAEPDGINPAVGKSITGP